MLSVHFNALTKSGIVYAITWGTSRALKLILRLLSFGFPKHVSTHKIVPVIALKWPFYTDYKKYACIELDPGKVAKRNQWIFSEVKLVD